MKKFAFALLVTAVAACPAAAQQKKAKKEAAAQPAPMAEPMARQPTQAQMTNQNSANFAKDSLPVFLPSWSMPAYMAISKPPQTQPQR
jgi:hypothetical protein